MTELRASMQKAYNNQKIRAKSRGIEWLFSFDTWIDVWTSSGKLDQRGKGLGKYCMARKKDVGPYSPENVEITLYEKNAKDARVNKPLETEWNVCKSLGRGRGWTIRNGSYQVIVSGKYVGTFKDQQTAEAAYLQAVDVRKQAISSCSGKARD